jgi:hypothetical protein
MEVNKENSYIGQNNFLDYSVITLCLIILMLAGYFFQNKLNAKKISVGPSLGRIVSFSNDIRLKKKEDLVWNPLQFNDKLREKDSIFSGDNSEVVLDLTGIGVIELSANTMIQILKEKDESVLDLTSGTFQVKKRIGKTISIRDHGKKIKLQVTPGDYKFSKTDSGLNIAVFSGEAKIEGKSEVVTTNSEFSIKENKIEVKTFTHGFLSPANNTTIYTIDEKIPFEIDSPCPDTCSIVFSNTEDFLKSIKQVFPQGQQVFLADVPLKGTIFFKLVDNLGSDLSLPFVFLRKPWSSPKIVGPLDKFKTKEKSIHFEWTASLSSEIKSHIQISRDTDFSDLVVDKMLDQNFTDLEFLEGEYFWRTRFELEKSQTSWTKTNKFIVDFELIHPIGVQVPNSNLLLVNGNAKLHFKINRDFEAEIYTISIYKDDKIFKKIKDAKDFYEISLTSAGNYKISVESFNEKNKKNGQSAVIEFKVVPFQPLPAPDLQNPDQEIEIIDEGETSFIQRIFDLIIPSAYAEVMKAQLSWKPIDGAVSYRLEVSTDQAFKSIILKELVTEPNFSWLPKKVGTFFWRVTPIDIHNLDGQTSKVGLLNVFPHFSKIAPPKIEAKIQFRDKESFVLKAKWDDLPRVSKYEAILSYFNQDNDQIGEHTLTTSTTKIQDKFSISKDVHNIKITVKAISKKGSQTPFSILKIVLPVLPEEIVPPVPVEVSKIEPFKMKSRSLQFSYEQFSMGSNWDSISQRVNNKVSKTNMKIFSSRYFVQKKWGRVGAGLDYFSLADGDLSISAGAVALEYAYDFSLNQKNSFFLSPATSAFYAPSLSQGLYGLKLNVPINFFLTESLALYAGLGYVYAQFFGIPQLQQVLDINVSFGGMNMIGGLRILF